MPAPSKLKVGRNPVKWNSQRSNCTHDRPPPAGCAGLIHAAEKLPRGHGVDLDLDSRERRPSSGRRGADADYISLEDPDTRSEALGDPRGLLGRLRRPAIIDEAQRAPDLFSYIQGIVDETGLPGQFVLSGSQDFLLMERTSQSLAGRAAVLRLLPLSLTELRGREPLEPDRLGAVAPTRGGAQPNLMETLFRGFYPRIHAENWTRPAGSATTSSCTSSAMSV